MMTKEIATSLELNTVFVFEELQKMNKAKKEKQPEILVATSRRLIVFTEFKQMGVMRISYLVLDEAHQLLEMGLPPPD